MLKISLQKLTVAQLAAGVDTSAQLAEKSGVHINTISRLRGGCPVRLPTVRKLAAALHCDPADIIEED